jgi:hypothetical protein
MWRSSNAKKMDEDSVLIKSSEGDAGASDKVTQGTESERGMSKVKIARWITYVDIGKLAWGQSKRQ